MATYGSPLEITFTYSGDIISIEHLVVSMSLNASGYEEAINQTEAFFAVYFLAVIGELQYDVFENITKRGDLEVTITSAAPYVSAIIALTLEAKYIR